MNLNINEDDSIKDNNTNGRERSKSRCRLFNSFSESISHIFKYSFIKNINNSNDQELTQSTTTGSSLKRQKIKKKSSKLYRRKSSYYANIIKPIALRADKLPTQNSFNFKSSTISLPIMTSTSEISGYNNSNINNNTIEPQVPYNNHNNYINEISRCSSSPSVDTLVRKKRSRFIDDDCSYDERPYLNFNKMKSHTVVDYELDLSIKSLKLFTIGNNNANNNNQDNNEDDDVNDSEFDYIDEGIYADDSQSPLTSSIATYSSSFSSINNDDFMLIQTHSNQDTINLDDNINNKNSQNSTQFSTSKKFSDIDLFQIENDLI